MLRKFLRSKLHRAVITQADLDYVGSLSIDRALMAAAGILPNEVVEVYNVTNGNRFTTYAIEAESGVIGTNGAAAHLARPGEIVIICCYLYLQPGEIARHEPNVIVLDGTTNALAADARPVVPACG